MEENPRFLHASGQFWAHIELQPVMPGSTEQVELQFGNAKPEKKLLQSKCDFSISKQNAIDVQR
jgi:hypothetical protein